jgi:hypothetical protein
MLEIKIPVPDRNANKAYDIEELAISIHKFKRGKVFYEIIWQSLREVDFNSMQLNGGYDS